MDRSFIDWAEKHLGSNVLADKVPYGDQSSVYRLATPSGNYFLKIGKGLVKERERLEWLDGRLPIPKVIGFTYTEDKDALLLSSVDGENLAKLCKKWPPNKIVDSLAEVLLRFHNANTKNCPFGNQGQGKVLVHGDACLPNFIFNGNQFSGYIDLGDMQIDSPEIDLSAAVWSLQYNLGPGHGLKFLKAYGVKNATEKMTEELKLQYEEAQRKWGLINSKH